MGFFQIKLDRKDLKYSFLAYCINLSLNYLTIVLDQVLVARKVFSWTKWL